MSGLVDKVKGMAEKHLDKKAQPGDQVEQNADNTVNQGAQPLLTH
jgi:hypothetical protein